MNYALAAIFFGTMAYFALVTFQSAQGRRDLRAWGDLLFVSGVLSAFLVIAMSWGMFENVSSGTLASVVEGMLWKRSSGLIRPWVLVGFAAIPFTALAASHVFVLFLMQKGQRPMTPNKSFERTREE